MPRPAPDPEERHGVAVWKHPIDRVGGGERHVFILLHRAPEPDRDEGAKRQFLIVLKPKEPPGKGDEFRGQRFKIRVPKDQQPMPAAVLRLRPAERAVELDQFLRLFIELCRNQARIVFQVFHLRFYQSVFRRLCAGLAPGRRFFSFLGSQIRLPPEPCTKKSRRL